MGWHGQSGEGAGTRARQPKQGEAAPVPALCPPRASSPLTRQVWRQSKCWKGQKEQANKPHNYRALSFVLELFIPVGGEDQRKDPEVLLGREGITQGLAESAAPSACVPSAMPSRALGAR